MMGKQTKSIEKRIQENFEAEMKAAGLSKSDEAYLRGTPTRMEVANYVTSLIENHYAPALQAGFQLGIMVVQALLIKKGICTGEEIEEFTKDFMKEHQERMKATREKQQQEQKAAESPEQEQPAEQSQNTEE